MFLPPEILICFVGFAFTINKYTVRNIIAFLRLRRRNSPYFFSSHTPCFRHRRRSSAQRIVNLIVNYPLSTVNYFNYALSITNYELNHTACVSCDMTADIYCYRQPRYMSCALLNIYSQRCNRSSEALRTNAQLINTFKHFCF